MMIEDYEIQTMTDEQLDLETKGVMIKLSANGSKTTARKIKMLDEKSKRYQRSVGLQVVGTTLMIAGILATDYIEE